MLWSGLWRRLFERDINLTLFMLPMLLIFFILSDPDNMTAQARVILERAPKGLDFFSIGVGHQVTCLSTSSLGSKNRAFQYRQATKYGERRAVFSRR